MAGNVTVNASGEEIKRLKRLYKLMQSKRYSQRRLAAMLNISKSMAGVLLTEYHYPVKRDRGELNGKIIQLIFELEKKKGKSIRERTFMGGANMEQITQETMVKFGLWMDPFVNEIHGCGDIFPLPESERGYEFLEKLARFQGFGALIGEVGSGKTLLLRRLAEEQGTKIRIVQPQTTNKMRLQYYHILDAIFFDLTGKSQGGGGRTMEQKARIVRDLLETAIKNDERVCLVIDDAHQMPRETMRTLKQLYDYYIGFRRQLGIILLGQLELINFMRDITLRETTQRCAYFFMRGLVTPGAVEKYLEFKIGKALRRFAGERSYGGQPSAAKAMEGKIFEKDVYKLIETHSTFVFPYEDKKIKICPQLKVQNLAARLMNEAERLGEKTVSRDVVMETLGA